MALEETMLKVMTLGNFFKTSHFKSCDSWQILQKPVTLKIVTLGNLFFKNQSLVIDYHYSVIDYTSTVVTLHV